MSSGIARSSSCNRWCAKRPTYEASNTKSWGNARVMEKSMTCEYGVLSLSSSPQVIANADCGGVTGKLPEGGGAISEQGGVAQAVLFAGKVNKSLNRAAVSTPCTPAELVMVVVKPN